MLDILEKVRGAPTIAAGAVLGACAGIVLWWGNNFRWMWSLQGVLPALRRDWEGALTYAGVVAIFFLTFLLAIVQLAHEIIAGLLG